MLITRLRDHNKGFTIIELMIATTVLSVILLLATVIMTSIGSLYYKGVNESRIQDDARSIVDDVSKHLQLSSGPPSSSITDANGDKAYCINGTRYTYMTDVKIGSQLRDSQNNNPTGLTFLHVLWRDTITSNCVAANLTNADPSAATGGTNGSELMAPNSQLTSFAITGAVPFPYIIKVSVAYGDNDLMSAQPHDFNTTCNGNVGDQFCATSGLQSTVVQRL